MLERHTLTPSKGVNLEVHGGAVFVEAAGREDARPLDPVLDNSRREQPLFLHPSGKHFDVDVLLVIR